MSSAQTVGRLLALGLVVRLVYFTGLSLGDDVIYATQSIAHASGGAWPPEFSHWATRVGVTIPTAFFLRVFGLHPLVFVLWPLLASTATVGVCYALAKELAGPRVAWIAGLFQATFPLEVIWATHLFPDVILGLFASLSLWYWIRALRDDRTRTFLLAGASFAAAYLCRETIVILAPVYLVLWRMIAPRRVSRMPWVAVIPAMVIAVECFVYLQTTGSAFYRWQAIAAQQNSPLDIALVQQPLSGGTFWTDPLLMVAVNQEFGAYLLLAFAAAPFLWRKAPEVRLLIVWFVLGFAWMYYGTTSPLRWSPLAREPRYASCLIVPAVIIAARAVVSLRPFYGRLAAGLLVATGLLAAALDQRGSILIPHREFVRSAYARTAALEPFEYFGARWALGLATDVPFDCVSDQGRASVVRTMSALPGVRLRHADDAAFVVVAPSRRDGLLDEMLDRGWTVTADFPGQATAGRAVVARLLAWIPSQQARAERLAHPSGLVVLQRHTARQETE